MTRNSARSELSLMIRCVLALLKWHKRPYSMEIVCAGDSSPSKKSFASPLIMRIASYPGCRLRPRCRHAAKRLLPATCPHMRGSGLAATTRPHLSRPGTALKPARNPWSCPEERSCPELPAPCSYEGETPPFRNLLPRRPGKCDLSAPDGRSPACSWFLGRFGPC